MKLEQLLNKYNLLGNVIYLKSCIHKVNIFSFVSFRFLFGILHCSYVQHNACLQQNVSVGNFAHRFQQQSFVKEEVKSA